MSAYTDALLAYHRAAFDFLSDEHSLALARRPDVVMPARDYVANMEASAQTLAQAGDVLEREMEAMILRISARHFGAR